MVASIKPHRDEIGLGDGLMLIDGTWSPARSGQTWSHSHPATGEQVASFPIAGPADVDLAVRAARRAFDEGPWPRTAGWERDPGAAPDRRRWSASTATSCSRCRPWTTACR